MKFYANIIWDWNGTLLDDTWLCLELLNKQLYNLGLKQLTLEKYRETFNFPVKDFYSSVGFDFTKFSYNSIATAFHDDYYNRRFECKLHEKAEEILNWVQSLGVVSSVLSAYQISHLKEMITHYGLNKYISHIAGLDTILGSRKTDLGKSLLKNLGIEGSEAVIVGDTIHDYEVAKEIGAKCILVSCGHNSRNRLLECGVPVCDSLEQLKGIITEYITNPQVTH